MTMSDQIVREILTSRMSDFSSIAFRGGVFGLREFILPRLISL
jgi:hypothetical protein